jgi:hypothetical protein
VKDLPRRGFRVLFQVRASKKILIFDEDSKRQSMMFLCLALSMIFPRLWRSLILRIGGKGGLEPGFGKVKLNSQR